MHERRFHGGADRLRSAERRALLEVERVTSLTLDDLHGGSVLDVGTGTGIFAEAFAGAGCRVTGLDPDAQLLQAAKRFVPRGEFIEGIAEELPFADSSFDLVFLGHVLHETDDPAAALREARRVARARVAVLEWPWIQEEHGPPLEHRLEPRRMEELAREAGFRVVERISLAHMDLYRLPVEPSGGAA